MDLDWNPHLYGGALETLQPNRWHTSSALDGPTFRFETAPQGLGGVARYSPAGMYGAGLQYGWRIPGTPLTLTPSAGLAYVEPTMPELPLKHPFQLGLQASTPLPMPFNWPDARLALEYLHMSNAGQKQPNIGLDTLSFMLGYPF